MELENAYIIPARLCQVIAQYQIINMDYIKTKAPIILQLSALFNVFIKLLHSLRNVNT